MKKIFLLVACAALMTSCGNSGAKQAAAERDSLQMQLTQRDAELEEALGTINDVAEGFRQINAAENRVDLKQSSAAEGSKTAREQIASDISFIQQQMQDNRDKIAQLQKQLNSSRSNSAQLKRLIENLQTELAEKTQRITELQSELAAKNIRIQELDAAVSGLSADKEALTAENEAKAKTVAEQDKSLNAAWFVFGTKSELKEQKILTDTGLFKKGKVMEGGEANLNYFTQIDIRTTKEIKLYSKSADLLTTHPAGSYALEKDSQGQLILKIKDPSHFWSVTRYLVIQVK
jgi:chromosome segregation ATPase